MYSNRDLAVVYAGHILDRMESLENITPVQRHTVEATAQDYIRKAYLGGNTPIVVAAGAVYHGFKTHREDLRVRHGIGTEEDIVMTVSEAVPKKPISIKTLSKFYNRHVVEDMLRIATSLA